MAGKKKPKEEHGHPITLRLKKRETKELDKFTDQWNFKNRTDLIKWCLELGCHLFRGNQAEMKMHVTRFFTQQFGEITDPRQKDIFEEFLMEQDIATSQAQLDVKHKLQEKARELTESLTQ